MNHHQSEEPTQETTFLSDEDLRSEIEGLRSRIATLEEYAATNRERIKNSKALNALLVVITPLLLFTGDFRFGDKWEGSLKSRDIDIGDIAPLLGLGAAALGVVSSDELVAFLTKRK